jgi:DinB superfamily
MAPEVRTEIVRTEIVDKLEHSRREFIAAVDGLSESEATAHPDPQRWSVLDCVEHVTTVEERFLGWLEAAEKLNVPPMDKEKEAALMQRVTDRGTRAQAPEAVVPHGRFATLAEALNQFNAGRSRSVRFAEDRCDELYSLASAHPRFGPMNGVEFLIIIAAHAQRHAQQIREARAALGKP